MYWTGHFSNLFQFGPNESSKSFHARQNPFPRSLALQCHLNLLFIEANAFQRPILDFERNVSSGLVAQRHRLPELPRRNSYTVRSPTLRVPREELKAANLRDGKDACTPFDVSLKKLLRNEHLHASPRQGTSIVTISEPYQSFQEAKRKYTQRSLKRRQNNANFLSISAIGACQSLAVNELAQPGPCLTFQIQNRLLDNILEP